MSDFTDVAEDGLVLGSENLTKWYELAGGQDPDDFVRGKAVLGTTADISVLDTAANFYGIATGNKTATHAEIFVKGTFDFNYMIAPSAVTLASVFDYARALGILLVEGA